MAYIVSANYRDRSSEYKWLIRKEDEPVSAARACKSVRATKVQFVRSGAAEEGFGCRYVAKAQEASGADFEDEKELHRVLKFDRDKGFYDTKTRKSVMDRNVAELSLDADGTMTALLESVRKS